MCGGIFDRVTLIKRLTKFRRILNLGTLVEALESNGGFEVTVAEFSHTMSFRQQLEVSILFFSISDIKYSNNFFGLKKNYLTMRMKIVKQ
jgi:hypothetical protein